MKVLITGAAGQVGSHLAPVLSREGFHVSLLDKVPPKQYPEGSVVLVGGTEDGRLVAEALKGTEQIVHLAWSFQDNMGDLLATDLAGQVNLFESAAAGEVKKFIMASSCVVYGSPLTLPVGEDHPCNPETGRKPVYGAAKLFSEVLCRVLGREKNIKHTVLRFWWGFGSTMAGKHLRNMIKEARQTGSIVVPRGRGGSFLYLDDFNEAVLLCLQNSDTDDQTYNLATVYCTWAEVAGMIVDAATGNTAVVKEVEPSDWTGPAFFLEDWKLDTSRYDMVRAKPGLPREEAVQLLYRAISNTVKAYDQK